MKTRTLTEAGGKPSTCVFAGGTRRAGKRVDNIAHTLQKAFRWSPNESDCFEFSRETLVLYFATQWYSQNTVHKLKYVFDAYFFLKILWAKKNSGLERKSVYKGSIFRICPFPWSSPTSPTPTPYYSSSMETSSGTCSTSHLMPAVNRQPSFRQGDS